MLLILFLKSQIFLLLLMTYLFLMLKEIECAARNTDRGAIKFPLLAKTHEEIRVPIGSLKRQTYDSDEDKKQDPCKSVRTSGEKNDEEEQQNYSKDFVKDALKKKLKHEKLKDGKLKSKKIIADNSQYVTNPKCDTHEEPPKQILHINPHIFNKTKARPQKQKFKKIAVESAPKVDSKQTQTFDYEVSHVPIRYSTHPQPILYHPQTFIPPAPKVIFEAYQNHPKVPISTLPPFQLHSHPAPYQVHQSYHPPLPIHSSYAPTFKSQGSYFNPSQLQARAQTLTDFPKFLYKSEVYFPPPHASHLYTQNPSNVIYGTQYSSTHPHPSDYNKNVEKPKEVLKPVEETDEEDNDAQEENEESGAESEELYENSANEEEEDENSEESEGSEKSSDDSDDTSSSNSNSSSSSPSNSYSSFSSSRHSDALSSDGSGSGFESDFFNNHNSDSDGKSHDHSGNEQDNQNEEYSQEYSYESSETKDSPKQVAYRDITTANPILRTIRKPRTKQSESLIKLPQKDVSINKMSQQLRSSKQTARKRPEKETKEAPVNENLKYFQ